MTDYFALLNFPRQPWLEPDDVKGRFVDLSAPAHPDRVHGEESAAAANERFADLNKAAAILREPRDRLNHLLELETGSPRPTTASLPNELIPIFAQVGSLAREVDGLIAERARITSPVLQAQLFTIGLDLTDRLEALQRQIAELRARAEAELREISGRWPESKPMARLGELAHTFATVARWEAQLRERYVSLAAA